ncbi:hypothetical protein AS9A_2793 [Hoyosella subflava DQS3-9A1]|uniref:Uncharacterized protein n=1 Tax=Hoyosella subflava (strain DSM 45089 / JCM 17490 / NBRC 109087 / DQS3-9A1) TaxID=443218 RepID=F6EJ08_HOYSD|nr:hypothetical protein AS9A_2793 [Hoyosella subflava DQS3-9A1]
MSLRGSGVEIRAHRGGGRPGGHGRMRFATSNYRFGMDVSLHAVSSNRSVCSTPIRPFPRALVDLLFRSDNPFARLRATTWKAVARSWAGSGVVWPQRVPTQPLECA